MAGWSIVVDRPADLPDGLRGFNVVPTRDYILRPPPSRGEPLKLINLSRDYGYQTLGYYCSLLAEARGHKVVPSVTTLLELRRRNFYSYALPELEEILNRTIHRLEEPPGTSFRLLVALGVPDDARFRQFGKAVFDWLRCPILEVFVQAAERWRVRKVAAVAVNELSAEGKALLAQGLRSHARSPWRGPRAKPQPRFTMAVLHDPKEELPPTEAASLKLFARVAERHSLGVELITRKDFDRVAEFDALWIRETTNIDHHTFRFAKRAEQEGMPVIDDPTSIVRCTNKVYLAELLLANRIPTPRTIVISRVKDIELIERAIPYPVVLKIPDGSFSRGVTKVGDRAELERSIRGMLEDSDLILAQEFMPTSFDWRVGVLGGEPLFVTQYKMARRHWQIVQYREGAKPLEGGFAICTLDAAPREVVQVGQAAARLIGDGLYGVDIKQNERGVFVIEVNDNPNLNNDVEAAAEGEAVWRKLALWFTRRLG